MAKEKMNEEKKSFFDFNPAKIAKFAFDAYNLFYRKIDKEIQKAKKKVKNAIIESSLVLLALVYLMIGGTMYLEKIFPKLTFGLNFVVVGLALLIIAFFHYLATK